MAELTAEAEDLLSQKEHYLDKILEVDRKLDELEIEEEELSRKGRYSAASVTLKHFSYSSFSRRFVILL